MIMFIIITLIALLFLEIILFWIFIHFKFLNHRNDNQRRELPKVTVFVPARNEEARLPECLESLAKLDYPEEKSQFIIGDDQSKDQSARIIREWVDKGTNRFFVRVIPGDFPVKNGKANALSQMDKIATGDFYFFTDADCIVNHSWIKEMLNSLESQNGLVSGITAIRKGSFFAAMQGIDWLINLAIVKFTSDLGFPLTALGNNMMVSKPAYREVGGFDMVPFSLTEDLALGQAFLRGGYQPIQQVSAQSLVLTNSENSFGDLLRQRKRWMSGAFTLPWYWLALLSLQLIFFPAIIYLLVEIPVWGTGLWLGKWLIQSLFIQEFAAKTETKVSIFHLFCFEFYYLLILWSTLVYYLWPSKIEWKGRKYNGLY